MTAISPAHAVGAVDIRVTTTFGTSATSSADLFTYGLAYYFNWYDLASAGVNADTIHITNVSGATANGNIQIPGASPLAFSVPTGMDKYYTFPYGTIGGPVTIISDVSITSTLRAWYYQSFNETPARTATSASTLQYFPWYDLASTGARADTIHITNVNGVTATGTIALTGATTLTFSVGAGANAYYTFPYGTIGGPVTITSNVAVLSSLRAWFNNSFNETAGRPSTSAAAVQYFPWYDLASDGTRADTIHITNPGTVAATGSVTLGTNTALPFNVPAGADNYVTFPYGTIGGPVTVTSTQPVIVSLRAWYFESFNEVPGRPASAAKTTSLFPWYDLASAGTRADTIHITNTGGTTATGTITLTNATTLTFSVGAGANAYYTFPYGTIGGPVTVTSSSAVLVSLRAWYYQSFNEVPGY
jgi:molybdopterin-binding protein